MAKPILIVKFPTSLYPNEAGITSSISEYIKTLRSHLKDEYHIIWLRSHSILDITFECCNPDNIPAITLEELEKNILK